MLMSSSYSIPFLVILMIVVVFPLACISFGIARIGSKSSGGKLFLGIGIGIVCVYGLLVLRYFIWIGAGRSGIVVQGTSPEGRQYCIIQTYKGWVEPYQVSFYIRDTSGIWRWNYLAHQDRAWKSATVTFSGGTAHVIRDGQHYRDILLPTNTVDLATVEPGYRGDYSPSNFTPQDILAVHNQKFKGN
jgi:hypothetical protein